MFLYGYYCVLTRVPANPPTLVGRVCCCAAAVGGSNLSKQKVAGPEGARVLGLGSLHPSPAKPPLLLVVLPLPPYLPNSTSATLPSGNIIIMPIPSACLSVVPASSRTRRNIIDLALPLLLLRLLVPSL